MDNNKQITLNNSWEKLIRHEDYELKINNTKILVKDMVFTPDPDITYSTSQILNKILYVENKNVLDIGCGTGIIGIECLKNNANFVVFSDIDNRALENTKFNLELNEIYDNFKLIKSNLFENISEKFDFIFANLPILDEVWNLEQNTQNISLEFLNHCKNYITKDGRVFLPWASFSDINVIMKTINDLEYDYYVHKEDKLGFTWYLIELTF